MKKKRIIRFRVEDPLAHALEQTATKNEMSLSEFMRTISRNAVGFFGYAPQSEPQNTNTMQEPA